MRLEELYDAFSRKVFKCEHCGHTELPKVKQLHACPKCKTAIHGYTSPPRNPLKTVNVQKITRKADRKYYSDLAPHRNVLN